MAVYAVLGAGRQGTAAAYDLLRFGGAERLVLVDVDLSQARRAAERIVRLAHGTRAQVEAASVNVGRSGQLVTLLKGVDVDVALSAVPYEFNVTVTRAAIEAGCSLCDLGGKTDVVHEQLRLDGQAKAAGVSVVPDCGLAPGLANTLAVYAMSRMEAPQEVRIYCGGLPQDPKPPLMYQLVFSVHGLINEYTGRATVLRRGRITQVEPLTEPEEIEFPEPVGRCEAFITSGGTSTCPWTFEGKLQTYEYKTVRYPGHYRIFKALRQLGLLDDRPVRLGPGQGQGQAEVEVSPRALFEAVVAPRLTFPEGRDLVVLRVICRGRHGGEPCEVRLDLMDFYDEATGFSAMERTTGFPAAMVAEALARGSVEAGVIPLEVAIPAEPFVEGLARRGLQVVESRRVG